MERKAVTASVLRRMMMMDMEYAGEPEDEGTTAVCWGTGSVFTTRTTSHSHRYSQVQPGTARYSHRYSQVQS